MKVTHEDYIDKLAKENQGLFEEVLGGTGWADLGETLDAREIARENFVDKQMVFDYVCMCTGILDNNLLKDETEEIFCEYIEKVYRMILIGNIINDVYHSSRLEVANSLFDIIKTMHRKTTKGYILELDPKYKIDKGGFEIA